MTRRSVPLAAESPPRPALCDSEKFQNQSRTRDLKPFGSQLHKPRTFGHFRCRLSNASSTRKKFSYMQLTSCGKSKVALVQHASPFRRADLRVLISRVRTG